MRTNFFFFFCSFTTSILAKLSSWCFEDSRDISSSLLVYPSHTDDFWAGRNTCMWKYISVCIYIYIDIDINLKDIRKIPRSFVKNRNVTLLYECLLVLYKCKTFFERQTKSIYIYICIYLYVYIQGHRYK